MQYAAVQGTTRQDGRVLRLVTGTVQFRGNKQAALRTVQINGGNKNGWFLYLTDKQVGETIKEPIFL